MKITPIVSHAGLETGKYTRWVLRRDFSEDHLLCLLCMIGEFDASASEVMRLLARHWSSLTGAADRSALALDALHRMARGERFDTNEWSRRMFRGRIRLELEDLPEPVRLALGRTVAPATWDVFMTIPEGYELCGKDGAGQSAFAYLSTEGVLFREGPERQRQVTAQVASFPALFAQALQRSSQARWAIARTLSQDHLRCLLWLVGEFAARSRTVLQVLRLHRIELSDADRAIAALQAMTRMALFGERIDVDELERRCDRGRGCLEFGDLPERARATLEAAKPGTQWQMDIMTPEGYEIWGVDATGRNIGARVSLSGTVAFR